jgi:hypothetical protein
MSTAFRAVQWNRVKIAYDGILLAGVALYIGIFMAAGRWWLSPPGDPTTWELLRVHAFGTCAFVMLTIILSKARSPGSTAVFSRCYTIGGISEC